MPRVVFVTGNEGKLREVNQILGTEHKLESHKLDLEEIQGSVDEVTVKKARTASELLDCAVLVEDTALEFNAFGGLPGVYIKWFLDSIGCQGLYDMLYKFEDKSARAICSFGFCEGKGSPVKIFKGVHEGTIVQPRGPADFGWNPVFQPKESSKTYSEMTAEEKNSTSHRARAMKQLVPFLSAYLGS